MNGTDLKAYKIISSWSTTCSACGGNAHPADTHHIKGGPMSCSTTVAFAESDSTLDHNNGCGAKFLN